MNRKQKIVLVGGIVFMLIMGFCIVSQVQYELRIRSMNKNTPVEECEKLLMRDTNLMWAKHRTNFHEPVSVNPRGMHWLIEDGQRLILAEVEEYWNEEEGTSRYRFWAKNEREGKLLFELEGKKNEQGLIDYQVLDENSRFRVRIQSSNMDSSELMVTHPFQAGSRKESIILARARFEENPINEKLKLNIYNTDGEIVAHISKNWAASLDKEVVFYDKPFERMYLLPFIVLMEEM